MSNVDDIVWSLAVFFVILWNFQWFLHILSIVYGKWKLHRKVPQLSPENPLPSVSILKPLAGVDANLYDNVETFFNIEYPGKYELLFCVQDESDPACMVIASLQAKYPKVDAKLFIGDDNIGPNPKINNMLKGYNVAKYEYVLVSDAGIRMKKDTLTDLVLHMTEKIGLVFQLPYVCHRKGFAALLEMVFFGTHPAKMCLVATFFGINCTTGMSCLMRKNVLDKAGGFEIYANYLAEDYFFSETMRKAGYGTILSSQPAWQNPGNSTVSKFQERICRWAKLRSVTAPGTRLEPMGECFALCAITLWAFIYLFDISPISFFLVHLLLWFLLDYILLRYVVNNAPLQCSKMDYLVTWLFRELTSLYLLLPSYWCNRYVTWRHKKFRLHFGGTIEEITDTGKYHV